MRNLILLICMFVNILCYGQKQKIVFFGEKIKAKEVTGINKFNDLGTKFNTSVINDLTDDYNTVYWRLGTVRNDANDYTNGSFSLFDLSNYNHKDGYLILDLIDFTYFEEVGFYLIEKKDSTILKNQSYTQFKENFKKSNQKQKRELLWLDSNSIFRELLFKSKYYENIQKISDEVERKLTRTLKDTLDVNFNKVLNSFSENSEAKAKLELFLNKYKNQKLKLKGHYVSIIFQPRYIGIAKNIISRIKKDELDLADEFNNNLVKYINNNYCEKDKKCFAFNSAIYGFHFDGSNDIIRIDSLDIKNEIKVSLEESIKITNKLNYEINNYYNRTFKNEFNKFWIIMFATDAEFDNLELKKITTHNK